MRTERAPSRSATGSRPDTSRRSPAARFTRSARSPARPKTAGRRLPTFTIDTEVGFRSAEERAAFADGLTAAVLELVSRYHHDDGHKYRVVVAAHPKPGNDSAPAPGADDPTTEEPR